MSLESFLRRVVSIAQEARIPYMLTGSLAAAYYAEPRATRDVDLVVVLSLDDVEELVRRLEVEGFYVSLQAARDAVRGEGQFNAIDPESGWKVDWIVRKDRPFSRNEFERRRPVEMMDLEVPLVAPEDLLVAKLEWARKGSSERQLRDALEILVHRGTELDRDHLERWVHELGLTREWEMLLEEENPWRPDEGGGSTRSGG